MFLEKLNKRESCCNEKKRGLESKPRGRQEIQNRRNTPANSKITTKAEARRANERASEREETLLDEQALAKALKAAAQ